MDLKQETQKVESRGLTLWVNSNKYYIALFFLIAAVYANSLFNGFVWDDEYLIQKNPYITDIKNIGNIFNPKFEMYKLPLYQGLYRPIRTLTFMIDYQIWGLNPFGFHLTNIMLYIVFVFLLFYFFKNVLKIKELYAFFAALVVGWHPVMTGNVAWIKDRHDIIIAIIMLLIFIYFKRKKIGYVVFLFIVGMLTKESTVAAPVYILFFWLFMQIRNNGRLDIAKILKKNDFKYVLSLVILLLVVGFLLLMAKSIIMNSGLLTANLASRSDKDLFGLYTLNGVDLKTYTATMSRIILKYFQLIILPIRQNADYQFPLYHNINLALLGLYLGSIIFSGYLFLKGNMIGAGFSFIFISMVPYSNIVPLPRMIAEKYLYFTVIGYGIIISQVIKWIFEKNKKLLFYVFLVYLLFFGLKTVSRNLDWKDNETLWKSVLKLKPSARSYLNLSNTYADEGLFDLALENAQKSAQAVKNDYRIYESLGDLYLNKSVFNQAVFNYKKALKFIDNKQMKSDIYNKIGVSYFYAKDYKNAEYAYKKGIEKDTGNVSLYENLATLYSVMGKTNKSIELRARAHKIDKSITPPLTQLGVRAHMQNKIDTALNYYNEALAQGEKSFTLFFNTAYIYFSRGQLKKAEFYFKKALSINPQHLNTLNNLGLISQKTGKVGDALKYYEKALTVKKDFAPARYNLARLYYNIRDYDDALNNFLYFLKKIDNNHGFVNYYVAMIYLKQGKSEKALVYFNKVLKMKNVPDKTLRFAGQMVKQLNAGRGLLTTP